MVFSREAVRGLGPLEVLALLVVRFFGLSVFPSSAFSSGAASGSGRTSVT